MHLITAQRTGFAALQRSLLAIVASLIVSPIAAHAQLPFQESFESEPGTTYSLSGAFDRAFDYFGRYPVPDTDDPSRAVFANGWDGDFGILSQDNDGDATGVGSGTVTVSIPNIDISDSGIGSWLDLSIALTSTGSFEPLALDNVRVDLAEDSGLIATVAVGAQASEFDNPSFENYEAINGDGIIVFAAIDGRPPMAIGRFSPPASGAVTGTAKGDLYLDPDFDGVGTGSRLTVDLSDFSFAFVPEPSGFVLGVFSMIGIASVRKRRKQSGQGC